MNDSDTPIAIQVHYSDLLASFRVAALQATRDMMFTTAARHQLDADQVKGAYNTFRELHGNAELEVTISFKVRG